MIAVTVNFEIDKDQIEDFMTLMTNNASDSKKLEDGCYFFDVCRKGTNVFLYEIYKSRDAFDVHLETQHFKTFDAAVADMVLKKDVRIFDEVIR